MYIFLIIGKEYTLKGLRDSLLSKHLKLNLFS